MATLRSLWRVSSWMLLCMACDGPPEPVDLERLSLAVVGGEPSPAAQDAVILLNRSPEGFCSGAVVSPTLVLTARHCMYDYVIDQAERLCGEEGGARPVTALYPLDRWAVYTGNAIPLTDTGARVIDVHAYGQLDTCDSDLALVELDRPFNITPLPLRLDAPPQVGEWGALVGWGTTSDAFGVLPNQRQQRQIQIEAVSPGLFGPENGTVRPLDPNSFLGAEGGCQGDSGGPLISDTTGAVIGIYNDTRAAALMVSTSAGRPGPEGSALDRCLNGTSSFQRLDLQRDWIRETFRLVGAAPWVEGYAQPGTTGVACSDADECVSGLCVGAANSRFCSAYCDDSPCPEGFECIERDAGRAVCSASEIEALSTANGSGCALGERPRLRWPLTLALLALLRARRGRTRCKPSSSAVTRVCC